MRPQSQITCGFGFGILFPPRDVVPRSLDKVAPFVLRRLNDALGLILAPPLNVPRLRRLLLNEHRPPKVLFELGLGLSCRQLLGSLLQRRLQPFRRPFDDCRQFCVPMRLVTPLRFVTGRFHRLSVLRLISRCIPKAADLPAATQLGRVGFSW